MYPNKFTYQLAEPSQRELIHQWLTQDHIKKWLHGDGLQNTLANLEQSFLGQGIFSHWIAYANGVPFGYLLTSKIEKDSPDEDLAQWCQEEGDAITLDLFICDVNFLGKGLAVPMIHQFLLSQFPYVSEVLIDPEKSNEKAVHVYQKAGFQISGEFIALWHPVPHYRMLLSMQKLFQQYLKVRILEDNAIEALVKAFTPPWSTKEKILEQWNRWKAEQEQGVRTVYLVELLDQPIAYASLLKAQEYPYFKECRIPEINALWVGDAYRRKGVAKMLIRHIEEVAKTEGHPVIGIGVGLYADYGPAQRLYAQLGYVPVGRGITYKGESVIPGKEYPVDDELLFWLTKSL